MNWCGSPSSVPGRQAWSWRRNFTMPRARSAIMGSKVFDESRLKVTLIEAGPRILPLLPERLSRAAHHELTVLGSAG